MEKRKSDYNTLSIEGNSVSFHTPSGTVSAEYEYQGFQTVKDDDGDITSVWYTFQAKTPDSGAPVYLAFNEHAPAPTAMKKNTRNMKKKSLISICAMVMKAWKLSWM